MHRKTLENLEKVKSYITHGRLMVHGRLYSERRLMDFLGLGRGAVRSIINELTRQGYLDASRNVILPSIVGRQSKKLLFCTRCAIDFVRLAATTPAYHAFISESEALGYSIDTSFNDYCAISEKDKARILAGEFAGIVFFAIFDPESVKFLDEHSIPYVVIAYEGSLDIPCSKIDFREVGRRAARVLYARGGRKTGAICGPLDTFIYREMLAGFRGALAEEEIYLKPENIIVMPPDYLQDNITTNNALVHSYFQKYRPDSLFIMRDYRAKYVYAASLELGIRIPADLSLVSFDNHTWPGAEEIGLSSIDEPTEQLSREGIRLLDEWIVSGQRPQNRIIIGETILRKSIGNYSAGHS